MSDNYLKKLLDSKDSRAVLKMELAKLRASVKDTLIIAMEGKDDKFIYSQWIRRIRPDLRYEPFACGGKKKVLALKSAVDADLNNLANKVLFIIDRDFDEAQGTLPAENLFMTDAYSVENYLVEPGVLQEILTNDLECHAQPGLRNDIERKFEHLYGDFLLCMREVNKRIFLARRLGINIKGGIPTKISDFISVKIDSVRPTGLSAYDFISLEREPTVEEVEKHQADFDLIDARLRHRGKFAIFFLMKWIDILADDRRADKSIWFGPLNKNCKINTQGITVGVMATKSSMPQGLLEFVNRAA